MHAMLFLKLELTMKLLTGFDFRQQLCVLCVKADCTRVCKVRINFRSSVNCTIDAGSVSDRAKAVVPLLRRCDLPRLMPHATFQAVESNRLTPL